MRPVKRGQRLYRLFDDLQYAQAMMRGSLRFGSLARYRDIEEQKVRGDRKEGTSVYSPPKGLEITNYTRKTFSVKEGWLMESDAKSDEIFVFCMSKSLTDEMMRAFNAVACVEITDVPRFCRRVENALKDASLGGKPGRERIGQAVQYYDPAHQPEARWAIPDMIASSKFNYYKWQDEFRLLYSRTDALKFQNVSMRLIKGELEHVIDISKHRFETVEIGSLDDIAVLHSLLSVAFPVQG